jgi:hypothetical protein
LRASDKLFSIDLLDRVIFYWDDAMDLIDKRAYSVVLTAIPTTRLSLIFALMTLPAMTVSAFAGPAGLEDGTYDAYDCTPSVSDERVVLSGSKLAFYESFCELSNPQLIRGLPSAILLDAACEGEGQTWTSRFIAMQTNDGGLVLLSESSGEKYQRCG